MINWLANPARFIRWSAAVLPWCGWATVAVLGLGLYLALVVAPPDYQQGEAVRIMYVHVPAAWWALAIYAFMGVASLIYFVWRHALADVAARAAAPIGATFCGLCLITGSLWGAPTWGTWWEWDGRLTSMLVLFVIYLGYIALRGAVEDEERNARLGA